jgi:mannitol-1-phosphate/altronate dehydrogenase
MKDKLKILARKLKEKSSAIGEAEEIFGDVVKNKAFVETFKVIYEKIGKDGSKKTLDWLLAME